MALKSFDLHWGNGTLVFKIYKGSITKLKVEAVISVLDRHGGKPGGLSAAILKEAGESVAKEIRDKNSRNTTENLITKAGKLPCKYIIHCACPRWENHDSRSKSECLKDLCTTVKKALEAACHKGIKSIGLPPIGSGGKFGIPKLACVAMYIKSITEFLYFLPGTKTPIKEIHFIDKTDDLVELAIDTYQIAAIDPRYLVEKLVVERLEDCNKNGSQSKYHRGISSSSNFVPGEQQFQNPYSATPQHSSPTCEHFTTAPNVQVQSNIYTPKSPNRKYIRFEGRAEHFYMNRLRVLVYTDDLTKVNNVDILVSTENFQNPGLGVLSKAILDKAGEKYRKEHAKLFTAKKKSNSKMIIQTNAGQLSFKVVLHAIIDKFPNIFPSDYHLDQLRKMTYNLLKSADEKKLKKRQNALSVALPLLGTGSITNSTCLAQYARAMLQGMEDFSSTNTVKLQTVHIVNFADVTTNVLVEVFKSSCSNLYPHAEQQNQNPVRHQQNQKQPRDEPKTKSGKETHKFNPRQYKMVDSWKAIVQQKQNLSSYLVPTPPKTALREEYNSCNKVPRSESKRGNLLMIDSDSEDSDAELPEPTVREQSLGGACAAVPDDNGAMCVICMDDVLTDPVQLKDCNHEFCRECIMEYLSHKSACPVCNMLYGEMFGNQPENGTAKIYEDDASLPGSRCGTLIIHYEFPDGHQSEDHPSPGEPYRGISRQGYLPDNKDGRRILRMLKRAFEHRLIFTVGFSRTSGRENVLTWNDIHHKTRRDGGPEKYGYPDPDYLSRVEDELNAKGISEK